jgi:hypothetical protein
LSTVSVVFIMALYHFICHPEWHSMITPPSRLSTADRRPQKKKRRAIFARLWFAES